MNRYESTVSFDGARGIGNQLMKMDDIYQNISDCYIFSISFSFSVIQCLPGRKPFKTFLRGLEKSLNEIPDDQNVLKTSVYMEMLKKSQVTLYLFVYSLFCFSFFLMHYFKFSWIGWLTFLTNSDDCFFYSCLVWWWMNYFKRFEIIKTNNVVIYLLRIFFDFFWIIIS